MLFRCNEIKTIFEDILNEKISFEDADSIGWKFTENFDSYEFKNFKEEKAISKAIDFFYGLDTQEMPREYIHTLSQVKEYYETFLNECEYNEDDYKEEIPKKVAEALSDFWVLCPICNESWKVEETEGTLHCPNIECKISLRNPYSVI